MTIPESVPRFNNVAIDIGTKTLKGVYIRPSIDGFGVNKRGDPDYHFVQNKYTVFSCDQIETEYSKERVVAYIDGAKFAEILLGREITLGGMARSVNLDDEFVGEMKNVFKYSWGEEFISR